ncbi:unnamed protein product [Pedinophyceae sp. YPF-701]|nr:unnamed protein product [Pedinophyceae sp. YPF-701]
MMRALAATPGGAHVTGLTVPALSGNSWDLWTHLTSEAELQGVARVLQTRTVRDRLRFLKIAVGRDALMQHRAAEVLHGALGGLSALQHLQLDHPSAHLANVVDQLSGLRTLEVRQGLWMHDRGFTAAEWSAFWVALERATDLRSLTLSDWADRDASAELRALPARLEVLCMNCEHPLRWWDGINLRSLNLERMGHFERWDRLAELLSRSRKLTRLRVGGISDRPHIDPDAVLAVFSALEHSQVEDLSLACSFEAEGAFREALGAAVASAVRNMPALQELHLSGPTTREADPDGWLGFDRSAAVAALRDTATLRTLRLDLCSSKIEPGLGAALGGLVSRSTSLAELHLHRFECPAGSYSELFQGLGENRTLQVLRCCSGGEAPLDNGFVRRLMDALYGGGRHEGRQLHTLEIRSSRVRHAGVAHIAQVLEDRPSVKLRRLTLEGVDVGLESIGFALQRNCALVSLRVPVNEDRIYREVATLEEALVDNTTLRHLDIRELEGGSLYSTNVGKQLREVWHAQRFAMALREAIGGKPNRTPGEYFMRMMAR